MSVLPVVERELRVASRRWSTFLVRSGVGSLACLISFPALFFGWVSGGGSGAGQGAFATLASYLFVMALLGGLLITADCLSGEKREGTLGLLFLTDLRGYDVVLGKFAALALHSIYGMVAVLPVLALPLLIGGVTGSEFGRVALALLNLLFVSLAAGMMVSAASRQASRAFFGTLVVLLLLLAGLPLMAAVLTRVSAPAWVSLLAWINPGHAFAFGLSPSMFIGTGEYWISLGLSHGLGWIFLIAAGVIAPGSWQDKDQGSRRRTLAGRVVGDRIARIFQTRRSPAWIDRRPMLWLMGERPVLKIILWSAAGLWCLMVVVIGATMQAQEALGLIFGWGVAVFFFFAVLLVEHSCRFWVESRQNGNLEALLAVPLEGREILASHWASIRRHFLGPLVVILCSGTLPFWIRVGSAVLSNRSGDEHVMGMVVPYAFFGGMLCWFLATFAAIGYTGMWFALKLRRPQFASGLTLLCVLLLPLMLCWLGFGVTLLFIFLPMSLLQSNLRAMLVQRHAPPGTQR